MYYVYILQNNCGRHYIGVTYSIKDRLKKHNFQASRWTKDKGPWTVIFSECFESKNDALCRERQIKRYKGGEAFKRLVRKT